MSEGDSERASLKTKYEKDQIMASGPITWQIERER